MHQHDGHVPDTLCVRVLEHDHLTDADVIDDEAAVTDARDLLQREDQYRPLAETRESVACRG